ncbi:hypothetical protein JTE90_004592 [Oedothorax gibbosus]|uniref:Histone deacetylase complex subunit SAP130 C-terminal domain-containing protein n=1 Tax=Oedothorax gibbosus TaxID=931172 RepID=A0AAV6UJW9_9ARAC|nr:hypothetical protein JTE90_004592 [Oedothorax gibbosus]
MSIVEDDEKHYALQNCIIVVKSRYAFEDDIRKTFEPCSLLLLVSADVKMLKNNIVMYNIRDPEDGSATYTDNSFAWRPTQIDSVIPEDSEFDPKMSESHLHYYPDHGSSLPDYLQEGIPEVQESYTMSYQTSTSTNGHGDGDASSHNSSSTAPVDTLISRNTQQTKTQQVKQVTKIIKTREVHHIGPDGKPISYSAYGNNGDYLPPQYPPTNAGDYGSYDPGRPPSPAGQTPSQVYQDYGTYSGSTGRNFDIYAPQPGQQYSDYGGEMPPHAAPIGDSPNLHRAMPQAPRQYNLAPANYEDIPEDPSGMMSAAYGYTGQPPLLPATSPGYHTGYDPSLPEGYLDRRPSFDETLTRGQTYAHAPRPGYEEEPLPLGRSDGSQHPVPPRHPHMDYAPVDSEGAGGVSWRMPDLHEVIDFLHHPNNVIRSNAAAYLQHLTYMDNAMKSKTRALGGIPPLIQMLNHDIPEMAKRNALGALRNLSYGRQNDENKRAICQVDGIAALVRLLKKSSDNEIRELVSGILWNLSSCEELKIQILDVALPTLVNHLIIPYSGWDRSSNPLETPVKPDELFFSVVFRNASGVIRNISSAGLNARNKLRCCEGLIESMVYLVRAALAKGEMDNKSVENCVCILRNLSYRLQEVEDPDYDKHNTFTSGLASKASGPIRAVGENLGCFGVKEKKDNSKGAEKQSRPLTKNPVSSESSSGGVQLLYQPELCHCYLSLLSESSNPDCLEASAGAIQNLAACLWQPSIEIRATVRMHKGLPILVELLRAENNSICCSVATALRNLSLDSRNLDLIGNYAMKDLILKLPSGGVCDSPQHDTRTSDDTLAAVLATLHEVCSKQSDFARSLIQLGGVERLTKITTSKNLYSSRVVKFASQLLFSIWQHTELRETLKRGGWKESHFVSKSLAIRNSLSPTGANSTLNRPVSTTGGTKYEDRTLPLNHGTDHNSTAASVPYSRSEELPLSELSHGTEPPPSSQHRPPHMGGVFPPGMQPAPTEPVYAQVNREKKKGRHSDVQLLSNASDMPAGLAKANMNNPKGESKGNDHEESDHTQPINLVAARTVAGTNASASPQPLVMRPHVEPPKPGLMTLYFRPPRPAAGQVIGPVVAPSTQHFTAKQGQDFKNSGMSSWTVIRVPQASDIVQTSTTSSSSGVSTLTSGILPSALSGGSRHMIPSGVHPVITAGNTGQSMASIIRSSHQGPPTGHVIHQQSFSSHVPRGPAAVASISAAPKSAVATPILRTPHSSTTMALSSSSMMALHGPVRAKSPTLANRTSTPPVSGSAQVVDLQKSNVGHTLSSGTTHISLGARTLDGSVVRTGPTHSSAISIAKPINISQPIVQHLQQVYDKGSLKTVTNLSSTSASSNPSPSHLPSGFTSSAESVVSRSSAGYSTSIMQLSSAGVGHSLQTLRATHGPASIHSNVTSSVAPHQTLTVISAKSLMPANHSIALATPSARSATPSAQVNASGNSTGGSNAARTLGVSNPTPIPVAKVYPQSPAPSQNTSDASASDLARPRNFMQQSVSSSGRVTTTSTAAMHSEKQTESNPVRFTSLSKPPISSNVTYASPSTTYLYQDQYPANLAMHPYSSNQGSSGYTTTQLRPVSFPQHSSSNTTSHASNASSNSSQSVGSVMVSVDSRHHVALHPTYGGKDMNILGNSSSNNQSNSSTITTSVVTSSYNNTQSQGSVNNHTSPRPSILRKRPSDGLGNVAKKNLSASLCSSDPISPRPDGSSNMGFSSVLPPKQNSEKLRDSASNVLPLTSENLNATLGLLPPSAIKKEPGISESNNADALLSLKESHLAEASPRKKPRKQLLATNELIETHSSEGDENNFETKVKIKKEPEEDTPNRVTYYKRPNMSLLNTYRQPWKARHNHFVRYTDVKPKEEKKPTVNELANQKGILQQANGWKVYHLSAQMEEVIGLEESVYSRLTHLLEFVEKEPKQRSRNSSDEDRIISKLTDLIKGNLQRSKIVQEQVAESKQQAIKVLDHKANIVEMVNKYVSRRPLKKKEKS